MSTKYNTTFYELMPDHGQKSFYGKAIVCVHEDGTETLYSYGTAIIDRNPDGSLTPRWCGWTATTAKHIRAFCGLNKSEYFKLAGWEKEPTQRASRWDYLTPAETYAYQQSAQRVCA